jgi:hypothetical protein
MLTELEVLQRRAGSDVSSVSQESLKVAGLGGAQALLDASRRPVDPQPLSLASGNKSIRTCRTPHHGEPALLAPAAAVARPQLAAASRCSPVSCVRRNGVSACR